MDRRIFAFAIGFFASTSVFAGGLMTNTNQSASWARRISTDATIDADNLYSNPAGVGFLDKDGMNVSVNAQTVWQTRTIESEFSPFAGNLAKENNGTKVYKGETFVPVMPSLHLVYKKNRWTASGYFAITGGGGSAVFKEGLGSFERPVSLIPLSMSAYGAKGYSLDCYLNGKQYVYGVQLGGSYRPKDWLSVFVGLRGNIANYSYKGHIRDIRTTIGGNVVNVGQFSQAGADKELNCAQKGFGLTPVIGFDVNYMIFNLAVKYEHRTYLKLKNDTKIDNTGMFADGMEMRNDIPGLLAVGLQVNLSEKLRVAGGYHHFFDKQAKVETIKDGMKINKQKLLDKGTNEYSFGVEYDALKWLQMSAGYQRTKYGLTDEYMSDMSFTTSSNTIGCGFRFRLSEWADLNLGAFVTLYEHYRKKYTDSLSGLPVSEDYNRTNKVVAMGVNFHF